MDINPFGCLTEVLEPAGVGSGCMTETENYSHHGEKRFARECWRRDIA